MTLAQASLSEDVVVLAAVNGNVYTFSMTTWINSGSATPIKISSSLSPSLNSAVLSLYASTIKRNDGTIDHVVLTLRDNGLLHMYNFNDQSWTLLGYSLNWNRAGSGIGSQIRFLSIMNTNDETYGTLYLNWVGGVYKLVDDLDDLHFTRFDPPLNSATFSCIAQGSSGYNSIFRSSPMVTTTSYLSWNQVRGENDYLLTITVSDNAATPTTLTMIIEGFETNTQAWRSDANLVKIILNSGLPTELHTTIRYTQLFAYSYNNKVLSWVTTTISTY